LAYLLSRWFLIPLFLKLFSEQHCLSEFSWRFRSTFRRFFLPSFTVVGLLGLRFSPHPSRHHTLHSKAARGPSASPHPTNGRSKLQPVGAATLTHTRTVVVQDSQLLY
jgi:hypothetical protein